jgi:hypothetical protein
LPICEVQGQGLFAAKAAKHAKKTKNKKKEK